MRTPPRNWARREPSVVGATLRVCPDTGISLNVVVPSGLLTAWNGYFVRRNVSSSSRDITTSTGSLNRFASHEISPEGLRGEGVPAADVRAALRSSSALSGYWLLSIRTPR